MKRSAFFGVFALLLGFFLGSLCPSGLFPWSSLSPFRAVSAVATPSVPSLNVAQSPSTLLPPADPEPSLLDPQDNALLLQAACAVTTALRDEDYAALADLVHTELGVTFTPYSAVDLATDLTFTAQQIRALAGNTQTYVWGTTDGRGSPIELTMADYFRTYVFNQDYTKAPRVGIDTVQQSGNALENVAEVYSSARFVEFNFPALDPANTGLDWCSLKTVFLPEGSSWKLIALIHSEWTV